MTAHPIPDNADLVDLIELDRRWQREDELARLEAELAAVWPRRASTRPQSRQSYQERALREHGKRMTAFWASPFGTALSPPVEPARGLSGFAASIADAAHNHQGEQ